MAELPINISNLMLASFPSITQYLWLLPALLTPPPTVASPSQELGFGSYSLPTSLIPM